MCLIRTMPVVHVYIAYIYFTMVNTRASDSFVPINEDKNAIKTAARVEKPPERIFFVAHIKKEWIFFVRQKERMRLVRGQTRSLPRSIDQIHRSQTYTRYTL